MTKRTLVLILVVSLALGGCIAAPKSKEVVSQQQDELVFPPPPEEPRFFYERSLYNSADVVPDTESELLKRTLTGETRTANGLSKPYGVAVRHGRVFVGDSVGRVVVVFDIPGQRFFKIGEQDPGALIMPLGLDLDKQGNLYVVDARAKQVMVYDWDGKFLRSIAKPEQLNRPVGIAVTPDGTRIYVVDMGGVGSQEHRVRVFDAHSGEVLFDIGKRGSGPGEFNLPRDIALAPDGSLFVRAGGNFRVQKFSSDGNYISTFGGIGRRSGQFSRPKEIAVDPAGNIYVLDTAFGNFQIFNPLGQALLAVGSRAERDAPAKFMLPSGIAVDEDGRVYMADQYFRKVDIFRPAALDVDDGFIGKNARAAYKPAKVAPPTAPAAIPAAEPLSLPTPNPAETKNSADPGP